MAEGDRDHPIPRAGARVLLLDARDRLLLFAIEDPAVDLPRFWVAPGGSLEAGESFEQAAIREVEEETGLRDVTLEACVWLRPHVWRWGERWIASDERYFLARVEAYEPTAEGMAAYERDTLAEARWWTLEQLEAATEETFVPRDLASLLRPLIEAAVPDAPIEVGE